MTTGRETQNQRLNPRVRGRLAPRAGGGHTPRPSQLQPARQGESMSIQRFEVGPRMSQAVVHGDTVYLAGQVANNPAPTVAK